MYGFRRKLILLMVTLVATAMLLAGLPGIYFARQKAREDAISQMRQSTRLAVKDFEKRTDNVEDACQALEVAFRNEFDPEKDFEDNESIQKFKETFIPEFKAILDLMEPRSLWLVFNTEHVDGKHTIAYYKKNDTNQYTRSPQYNIYNRDLEDPSMQWWHLALEKGEGWTNPYFWEEWDMEVISFTKAIDIDAEMVAAIGSDFHFGKMKNYLDTLSVFESGNTILFNEKKNPIYSSYTDQNGSFKTSELTENIGEEPSGYFVLNSENGRHAVSFERMKNGWTLAITVPKKEIFAEVNSLFHSLLIIFASVFLIALLLALYFSKYITTPVKTLLSKFREATNGNLNARAKISTNDEMHELANHFNQMMSAMERSFEELQQTQQRLIVEKDRAQESDSLKSSFLENLSHEIRTPLMAIVGFSELMADPESTADERRDFFNHIAQNTNQLVRFIEDTLLFSQLEKSQAPVEKTRFKLREIFGELQSEFEARRQKEKPHLYFRILADDCETYMYSDPVLFKRLLRYLLDNAFKFTESGGISLVCRETEHHVEVSVSDSGIGISEGKTDVAFRKFCKVVEDRNRVYEGAGIGLTNARGLTLLLGGTIELSSVRNEGTTVTVSFPFQSQHF
ncbi:MAG: ATP-binding protein [Bacteroidota bacterium]